MAQRGSGGTVGSGSGTGWIRWPGGGRKTLGSQRRFRAHEAIGIGAPLTAAFMALASFRNAEAAVSPEPRPEEGTSGGERPHASHETASSSTAQAHPGPLKAAVAAPAVAGEPHPAVGGALDPGGVPHVGEGATIGGAMPRAERLDRSLPEDPPPPSAGPDAPAPQTAAGGAPVEVSALAVPGEPADPAPGEPDLGTVGLHVQGGAGADVLRGSEGNDQLAGGAGDDRLLGGAGDDRLEGGDGSDELRGEAGADRLSGGPGDDVLQGGTGNDLLSGGSGNDHLVGGEGRDALSGGPGDDLLEGGPGLDRLDGGPGDDILSIDQVGDVALDSGGGSDTLRVEADFAGSLASVRADLAPDGAATFVVGGGLGDPLPDGVAPYRQQVGNGIEHVELRGDAGHDLVGDGLDNHLTGNAGDNAIWGGEGDDLIHGGGGDDLLFGGDGDDLLAGDGGHDLLYGGAGDDGYLLGLAEDAPDRLYDPEGVNHVRLDGIDPATVQVERSGNDLVIRAEGGKVGVIEDFGHSESAWSGIDFGEGVRPFTEFGLGSGDADDPGSAGGEPSIRGTGGDDILQGTEEADRLAGGEGNDTLSGGAGDDLLDGGPGNDLLQGGPGEDTYVVRAADPGIDRIEDASGPDHVRLEGAGVDDVGGFLAGDDLWVAVDGQPALVIDGFARHPESLASIRGDDGNVSPRELAGDGSHG